MDEELIPTIIVKVARFIFLPAVLALEQLQERLLFIPTRLDQDKVF